MKNYLFKIRIKKEEEERASFEYVVARNDKGVFNYINKKFYRGSMVRRLYFTYKQEIPYLEKGLIKSRGCFNCQPSFDAAILCGWTKGKKVTSEDINVLQKLKIIKHILN